MGAGISLAWDKPGENRSGQLDQARLPRFLEEWDANLFAFVALSRVMGWNTCKFFYPVICIVLGY